MKRFFYLSTLVLFISLQFAQISVGNKTIDFLDEWDFDEYFRWNNKTPIIELIYGQNSFKHNSFNGKFSKNGSINLKLGYKKYNEYDEHPYLVELSENFFHITNSKNDLLLNSNKNHNYNIESWLIGFGNRKGMGYNLGLIKIIPYTQSSYNLIMLKRDVYPMSNQVMITPSQIENDNKIIDRFGERARFTQQYASGIKIGLGEYISVNANYEVNTVYPRILTWKMLGSYTIQGISFGFLNSFLDEIEDSTPEVSPVVNIILKSALNYTFYQLRKEKMNWPFHSENPLNYDAFNIGLTFNF